MKKRFQILKELGIGNMGELLRTLKTKQKVEEITNTSGIPEDYLNLLRREAGSYLARPFPLSEFPGVPFEYIEILKSKAIRQTREFFETAQTAYQRNDLAKRTGIPKARLHEIFVLCNLSRITGIGGIFARIVYEAGIRSVEAFAKTKARVHIEKYTAISQKHEYASGSFSEEDLQYCIDYAKVIEEFTDKTASL